MKTFPFILLLTLITSIIHAQDISEHYVRSVVTKLASDEMKGRSAKRPDDAYRAANYILSEFKHNGLEATLQEFIGDSVKMTNVVATLKGKSKPEEIVIFSAHYDHIGVMQPIAGDSISNGADDDASGTTAVIALAKYFKKLNNNERTLIFVAFSGEELGGYGSKYFTEQMDPGKVVAMFNIEMIGKHSKWGTNSVFITGFEKSDFGKILQKNVAGTKFSFEPDPYPDQQLFYRSDNARLAIKGVPAHSLSTDEIDKDKLYHTVNDEVESLDIKNMTEVIKAIALGSKTIVNGTDTPTRIPPLKKN